VDEAAGGEVEVDLQKVVAAERFGVCAGARVRALCPGDGGEENLSGREGKRKGGRPFNRQHPLPAIVRVLFSTLTATGRHVHWRGSHNDAHGSVRHAIHCVAVGSAGGAPLVELSHRLRLVPRARARPRFVAASAVVAQERRSQRQRRTAPLVHPRDRSVPP